MNTAIRCLITAHIFLVILFVMSCSEPPKVSRKSNTSADAIFKPGNSNTGTGTTTDTGTGTGAATGTGTGTGTATGTGTGSTEIIDFSLDSVHNFYGIAWRGNSADNLAYAKQMGYRYVFYKSGMENEQVAKEQDTNFFIESPDINLMPINAELDLTKTFTEQEKEFYQNYTCWKSTDAFPKNLATGWPRNDHIFTVIIDWQQQKVIDYFVNALIAKVRTIQTANSRMKFAGIAWDEVNLMGNFESHKHSRNSDEQGSIWELSIKVGQYLLSGGSLGGLSQDEFIEEVKKVASGADFQDTKLDELALDEEIGPIIQYALPIFNSDAHFPVPISYWTGNDSCVLHSGITHEYATFTDGLVAYFKTIMSRARTELNPNAKWIIEPYKPFKEWVDVIDSRADKAELIPSAIRQESGGNLFAEDQRIFSSGLILKTIVGSTAPNDFSEAENRQKAGVAGINGHWWNWYGRFGGSGDMPDYQGIKEIPARLKIIRMVPTWDNLSNIPLNQRSWDGEVYKSTNSYVSSKVIYTRQPGTKKIFVVFLTTDGSLTLNTGEQIESISNVDDTLIETTPITQELTVNGNTISANANTKIDSPSAAYIIKLK